MDFNNKHNSSTDNSKKSFVLTSIKKNFMILGTINSITAVFPIFFASKYNKKAVSSEKSSSLSINAQHCSSNSSKYNAYNFNICTASMLYIILFYIFYLYICSRIMYLYFQKKKRFLILQNEMI